MTASAEGRRRKRDEKQRQAGDDGQRRPGDDERRRAGDDDPARTDAEEVWRVPAWQRVLLVVIWSLVAVGVLYLLFFHVFPWVEQFFEDPTMGA